MKIAKDCAVTLRMRMLEIDGHPGPAGSDAMAYLHGGYGNLFANLEAALEGQEAGYAATLSFSAEDAFGSQDPALAITHFLQVHSLIRLSHTASLS